MKTVWYAIYDGNPIEDYVVTGNLSADDVLYHFADDYDFATDRVMIGGIWYNRADIEMEVIA